MTVITSLTATPNRILNIVKLFQSTGIGNLQTEDVLLFVSPLSLRRQVNENPQRDPHASVRAGLNEAIRLGLILENPNSVLSLNTDLESNTHNPETIFNYIKQILFNRHMAEKKGLSGVTDAIIWFLLLDPLEGWDYSLNPVQEISDTKLSEHSGLTNNARFQQFCYWAGYLGLTQKITYSANPNSTTTKVVPDITNALKRELIPLLDKGSMVPISELWPSLLEKLPILEDGESRIKFEELYPDQKKFNASRLSPTTSFALERLDNNNLIELVRQSDFADPVNFFADTPNSTFYTHIKYEGKGD